MARHTFTSDVNYPGTARFTVCTTADGTSTSTDLLTIGGDALTQPAVGQDFQGPDGVTRVWLQPDNDSTVRFPVDAADTESGASLEVHGTPSDGDTLTYNAANGQWVPGAGGSGASVGLGDFANWHRSGALDATSGSFDYTADLLASSGSTIAVDDSPAWVDDYGAAVPMVTEAGSYFVYLECGVQGPGIIQSLQISFMAADESTLPFSDAPNYMKFPQGGGTDGSIGGTVYLPANAHIDVSVGATVDPEDVTLAIQKVG